VRVRVSPFAPPNSIKLFDDLIKSLNQKVVEFHEEEFNNSPKREGEGFDSSWIYGSSK
jgi:hypothetical protein